MTIDEKMKEISENLEFLEGLEKMEYIVDIARKAPGLPESQKNDTNKIYGCMSETWVLISGSKNSITVNSDSEAQIVKGMLHLLSECINTHSRDEILALDEQTILDKLGLGGSLTNRRMNGFASAILKIKEEVDKISL